jgi:type II secretory pathway pseudopilin PulG
MLIEKKTKKSQRGFNLIEAAIVLGIVGLVIGGIWVAASAVQENMRKSDASKGMIQMVQNVRNLYYGQTPDATGDITADLVNANAIPGDFVNGTGARNPWNGVVTVSIADATNYDEIDIAYVGVPKSACIEMTSRNTNISTGVGLQQIIIDVTDTSAGGADTTVTAFPYLPTDAAGDCGAANTITWKFGLRG